MAAESFKLCWKKRGQIGETVGRSWKTLARTATNWFEQAECH
jgi:hypothetical protein